MPRTSMGNTNRRRSSIVIGRTATSGQGMRKLRPASRFTAASAISLTSLVRRGPDGCVAPPGQSRSATHDLVKRIDIRADVRRRSDDDHLRENFRLIVKQLMRVVGLALPLQDLERTAIGKRTAVFEEVLHDVLGVHPMLHPGECRLAMRGALDDTVAGEIAGIS